MVVLRVTWMADSKVDQMADALVALLALRMEVWLARRRVDMKEFARVG